MLHPNPRFPESILSSDIASKIDYFSQGYVLNHSMINFVHESLVSSFFETSEQQIALITGPTGVGKSCLAHEIYQDILNTNKADESGVPILYIEADVHGSGIFSWKEFYRNLLLALGESEKLRIYGAHIKNAGDCGYSYSNRNRTEYEMRRDLELRFRELNVHYVIIDEVQHMFKYGGNSAERSLDILKNISNKTQCRFVGIGTYEVSFSIEKSAQLARRIKSLEFPAYSISQHDDKRNFASALSGLLSHIPGEISDDLGSYLYEIFVGCCGCVGILKEWLTRAFKQSLENDAELSIESLRRTRLRGQQLKSIASEISEGVAYFRDASDDEILSILDPQKPSSRKLSNKSSTTPKIRPGVRKPARDKVGGQ